MINYYKYSTYEQKNSAFTLVELAIVLVIIGLLVAGIVLGKILIEEARVKSGTKKLLDMGNAYEVFHMKYNALPGDTDQASLFFPNCDTPATDCDGDDDGVIEVHAESLRAIQLLGLAGLIGGSYTGELTGGTLIELGINIPESGLNNSGFEMYHGSSFWIDSRWNLSNRHVLVMAEPHGSPDVNFFGPSVSPQQAYIIDLKVDDGNAVTGILRTNQARLDNNSGMGYCSDGGSGGAGVFSSYNAVTTVRCVLHLLVNF